MTGEHSVLDEERRLVTVLFADLVGYTSLSEARDPEVIYDALNLCMDRLASEIRRYGGYVDKVVGDEIIGLFGAPRAQEDDAGKAIAAGVAMQRALLELGPQLQEPLGATFRMRVGINTGLVVAGAVGPGGYTVTGDAMNVGARLESQAEPGSILVGETTRRLARRPYRWGERQELTVKGRTEPVVCYTAEGLSAAPLRLVPAPSETPFVGRQEHLDRIRALWDEAAAGNARVLQLVGESGIGKTRLLAHLFAQVGPSPEHVLYTRTDTPPRTFGPLLQLLPSLRENLPAGFEERIEALAREHESATPVEVEPNWLIDGLTDVMRALCAEGPVALVLDDMHRADRATIDIVDRLLTRLASLPVLTLLLKQPVGRRVRHVSEEETVTLEPLSAEQGRDLVRGVAPELAATTVDRIVERAGGNPLYLEMLATATSAAPEGAPVSESLQTAVVARIDELDETSRRVLREATVFGHSFYEEPLKLTTTVSEGLYETLAHLCEVGLLDDLPDTLNRGYQFRHSLVQEVLYAGLLLRQRVELHRRAGEALELAREEGLEVEPEQLAYHFREAGDSEGVEGKFFVWDAAEIDALLGADLAPIVRAYYGVTGEGNFEAKNILWRPGSDAEIANSLGIAADALVPAIDEARERLLAEREKRVRPGLDDKVLTSWNALMLKAFAEAGAILDGRRYVDIARRNADFLLGSLVRDGRLLRTWKAGEAKLNAYLEDHAYLIDALLALYEATFEQRWLDEATSLADRMIDLFWDASTGAFFDTGRDHEELVVRPRDIFDNATPSGGSAAAMALLRLAVFTGNAGLQRYAVDSLRTVRDYLTRAPSGFANWLCALDFYLSTPKEIVIIGPRADAATQALLRVPYGRYLPNRALAGAEAPPEDTVSPLLQGREMMDGRPTAYVCENYACRLPVTDPADLATQLDER